QRHPNQTGGHLPTLPILPLASPDREAIEIFLRCWRWGRLGRLLCCGSSPNLNPKANAVHQVLLRGIELSSLDLVLNPNHPLFCSTCTTRQLPALGFLL